MLNFIRLIEGLLLFYIFKVHSYEVVLSENFNLLLLFLPAFICKPLLKLQRISAYFLLIWTHFFMLVFFLRSRYNIYPFTCCRSFQHFYMYDWKKFYIYKDVNSQDKSIDCLNSQAENFLYSRSQTRLI